MVAPVLITRTTKAFEVKGSKELVSTTFIARFEDGTEKFLNSKKWVPIGLRKEEDGEYTPLFKDNCVLYWKDWSKNPTFGTMEENFPPSLLPQEIIDLF